MLYPVQQIGNIIVRPERLRGINIGARLEPARSAPFQPIELDIGIAGFSLLHQPPLIAAMIVLIGAATHMAGLRPIRRIRIAADLDLENMQAGPIARFEEIIKYPALLARWIVKERAQGAPAATDSAKAHKSEPCAQAINRDRLHGGRVGEGCAPFAGNSCKCRARGELQKTASIDISSHRNESPSSLEAVELGLQALSAQILRRLALPGSNTQIAQPLDK